jgi:hypothetical protein
VVRVANLAQGTTAEDVVVSFWFFETTGREGERETEDKFTLVRMIRVGLKRG